MKRLKDYPLNEWMEAADKCDMCGAQKYVQVTWVDETEDFGEVETKVKHAVDCYEIQPFFFDESKKQIVKDFDFAGWEYADKKIAIGDKAFTALKSRANIGICLNCEKFVVGVPLILWPENGEVELDFCFKCAKELGILEKLVKGLTFHGCTTSMQGIL